MKELRERRFLTQAELGERAGLSMYTVNAAEREHPVSLKTARALASGLGVDPTELLPEEREQKKVVLRSEQSTEERLAARVQELEGMDLPELGERLAEVKDQMADLKVEVPHGRGVREEVTDFPLYLELTDEALALATVLERKASKQLA